MWPKGVGKAMAWPVGERTKQKIAAATGSSVASIEEHNCTNTRHGQLHRKVEGSQECRRSAGAQRSWVAAWAHCVRRGGAVSQIGYGREWKRNCVTAQALQ